MAASVFIISWLSFITMGSVELSDIGRKILEQYVEFFVLVDLPAEHDSPRHTDECLGLFSGFVECIAFVYGRIERALGSDFFDSRMLVNNFDSLLFDIRQFIFDFQCVDDLPADTKMTRIPSITPTEESSNMVFSDTEQHRQEL